jgi:hypothetical protein
MHTRRQDLKLLLASVGVQAGENISLQQFIEAVSAGIIVDILFLPTMVKSETSQTPTMVKSETSQTPTMVKSGSGQKWSKDMGEKHSKENYQNLLDLVEMFERQVSETMFGVPNGRDMQVCERVHA